MTKYTRLQYNAVTSRLKTGMIFMVLLLILIFN